jgi:hypothetical protein
MVGFWHGDLELISALELSKFLPEPYFSLFLDRDFLCEAYLPWLRSRNVILSVVSMIMWRYSPRYVYRLSWSLITKVKIGQRNYILLFQRLLSFQPSSQGASDKHIGRFPAGFALCVHDYIHALALILMWLVCEVGWGPLKPWDDSFHDCLQW